MKTILRKDAATTLREMIRVLQELANHYDADTTYVSMNSDSVRLTLVEETLSDRSKVYNIELSEFTDVAEEKPKASKLSGYSVTTIQKAVNEAIEYAQQFKDTDDGGTCNFDACYISVPGMRETVAESIQGVFLCESGFHGRRLQLRGTLGQAARRTKMAEAQRDYLVKNYPELKVGMYYQMD